MRSFLCLVFSTAAFAATYAVKTDGSGNYTTIAACAAVAVAGDTCTVYPGNYDEYVTLTHAGTATQRITFTAVNPAATTSNSTLWATAKGFRVNQPHITIDGFDFTKYNSGTLPSILYLPTTASYTYITRNQFRDGVYLTRSDYVFDTATKTITTATGGFSAAGFVSGMTVYIGTNRNAWDTMPDHDLSLHVTTVTDTVLTVSDTALVDCNGDNTPETAGICTEGPEQHTIYFNPGNDSAGVRAIQMIYSGGVAPSNCLIAGNKISNIAGVGMLLAGDNHRITKNTFSQMNGWKFANFAGSNNLWDKNVFLPSPRWPWFMPPDVVSGQSTRVWDMIDSMFYSARVAGMSINNNVFDSNFFLDLDNQFMTIGDSGTGPATTGLTFTRNVFAGIERAGASHRPNTTFKNNTFYMSGHSDGNPIIVGNSDQGNATGSVVKDNVFVGNGMAEGTATLGWYSIAGNSPLPPPTMGEAPNWNYVAGTPAESYAAKSGFAGDEVNGINGGAPSLQGGAGFTAGILVVAPIYDAAWNASAKTVTKTGAFAGYTWRSGDEVRAISHSPTNAMVHFTVASKTNNNTIVLQDEAGRDTIVGDRTDLEIYPVAPTALILGADGIPFTTDDGLKPATNSLLCASGDNGTDIGAYSCASGAVLAGANNYSVVQGGGGDYTTIQACATAAQPGDTCTVFAGSYGEQVTTPRSGSSNARITFLANGAVTTKGFTISQAYVTVNGFTFSGSTSPGEVYVQTGGNYCEVFNNLFGAGGVNTYGIQIVNSSGPTGCHISGNTFNGALSVVLQTGGTNHLIENNDFQALYYEDYIRPWGSGHTFRRNKLWKGVLYTNGGHGHMDAWQIYHSGTDGAHDMLFEENLIADLPYPTSMGQYNVYAGVLDGVMYTDVGYFTFRHNIFANIYANWSFNIPHSTFENNTFFSAAYGAAGITTGNALIGNDVRGTTFKNNAFIGMGNLPAANPGDLGWYSYAGSKIDGASIDYRITHESVCGGATCSGGGACGASVACSIFNDLKTNSYLDSNGYVLAAALALTGSGPSEMTMDSGLSAYKTATYNDLILACTMDRDTRSAWVSDYNFVSGSAGSGYAPKKTTGCSGVLTANRFCETNGINGVNPQLQAGSALSQGILALAPFSSASWVESSKTLTKTGAFASYTWHSGDTIYLTSSSPSLVGGIYSVASKTDSNNIVISTLLNGPGIGEDRASVSATPITPTTTLFPDGGFTLSDGLKPLPGSPLCGGGVGGKDIGAYSCDPTKVFPDDSPSPPTTGSKFTGTITGVIR